VTTFPQVEIDALNQLGLLVNGPVTGVGAGAQLTTRGAGGRGWEILATGQLAAQGQDKLNIRDLASAQDVFTIDKNGNVGIGVTGPTEKLDVNGTVRGSSNLGDGVSGVSDGGVGVRAFSSTRVGVVAEGDTLVPGTIGLVASGNHLAARFDGNVLVGGNLTVSGTVTKGGGAFQIDHPLDPANKNLFHSFVESPDMKNVYDGVVVADSSGEAGVGLPPYFDALNKDFRYQLTPIGAPAPNLYVKEELAGNRFAIAGAAPGQRVCWQITGIRKDDWALANPIIVERDKPKRQTRPLVERGDAHAPGRMSAKGNYRP
jgi:hypothetical protein